MAEGPAALERQGGRSRLLHGGRPHAGSRGDPSGNRLRRAVLRDSGPLEARPEQGHRAHSGVLCRARRLGEPAEGASHRGRAEGQGQVDRAPRLRGRRSRLHAWPRPDEIPRAERQEGLAPDRRVPARARGLSPATSPPRTPGSCSAGPRRPSPFARGAATVPAGFRGATLHGLIQSKPRAALQTFHALQASELATAFNDALKRVCIQPGDYTAELTAPAGPSTAGGVQAMQHLRLVSSQPGTPTLVVGHANHAEGRAELRTFEHLDAVHRQRFRRPLTIDRTQYDDFVRLAKQLLDALHLQTILTGPPLDLEMDDDGPSASSAGRWLL